MTTAVTKKLTLWFPKCESEKPIVYHLVRDYGLMVNVVRARVTPEEEGYLVLEVSGPSDDFERGMEHIRTYDVVVNFSGRGLTWNQDRCTGCGNCLTHCRTGALHIPDRRTMAVSFDDSKCLECMGCLKACPYGAITSAF